MLLRDSKIVRALRADPPLVDRIDLDQDLDGARSPVQAASLDLTVGQIYLPDDNELKVHTTRKLPPGHTAVVETAEVVHLPSDIGAIGFPPARVSAQGLLTTNPGHIDPGYHGRLSLTVINMGREDYPLASGGPIMTLLFFELGERARADYQDRNGQRKHESVVTVERMSHLSGEFLQVADRAAKIAREEERQSRRWTVGFSILVMVLTVAIALVGFIIPTRDDVSDIRDEVNEIRDGQVDSLEDRVRTLERQR